MKIWITLCAIVALSVASPQSSDKLRSSLNSLSNLQLLSNVGGKKPPDNFAVNRNSSRRNYNRVSLSDQQEQSNIVGPHSFAQSYNSSKGDFKNYSFSNEQVQTVSLNNEAQNQNSFVNENIPENAKDINEHYNIVYNLDSGKSNTNTFQIPLHHNFNSYVSSRKGHKKPNPFSNQQLKENVNGANKPKKIEEKETTQLTNQQIEENVKGDNKHKNIDEKKTPQFTNQQIEENVKSDNEPTTAADNINLRKGKDNPNPFYNQRIDETINSIDEPSNIANNINARKGKDNPSTFYNQRIDETVNGINQPKNLALNINQPQLISPYGPYPLSISYLEKINRAREPNTVNFDSRNRNPSTFYNQQIDETVNSINQRKNLGYNINQRQLISPLGPYPLSMSYLKKVNRAGEPNNHNFNSRSSNPNSFYNQQIDETVNGINQRKNLAYNINQRQLISPLGPYPLSMSYRKKVNRAGEPNNHNFNSHSGNPNFFTNQRIDEMVSGISKPYNAAYDINSHKENNYPHNPYSFTNQEINANANRATNNAYSFNSRKVKPFVNQKIQENVHGLNGPKNAAFIYNPRQYYPSQSYSNQKVHETQQHRL